MQVLKWNGWQPTVSFRVYQIDSNDAVFSKKGYENVRFKLIYADFPCFHDTKDSSCALMGPSGCGKSSLLNVLTGRALHYGASGGWNG